MIKSLLGVFVTVLAVCVVGCGESTPNDVIASNGEAPDPANSPVATSSIATSSTTDGTAEPTEAGWLNGFDAVSTDAAAEPKSGRIPVEGELIDPDAQADDQVEETKLPDMKVRQRSKVRAGGVLDLTFDDVEFEIEKDADFDRSMLTPEIEAMDGKEVIIRGFVLESYQLKNIKEFILVRDNQECCFGPGAFIYHNMQVEMVGDARAEYTIRPITIRGKFTIKPFVMEGKCYSVFHVAATSFKK